MSCQKILFWFSFFLTQLLFVSVYESFKDYITVESLDGDNKYDAGEHGLQVCNFPYTSILPFPP